MSEQEFDFFDLDESQLDVEWGRQAKLYHTYAVQLADLRMEWEQTKAAREVAIAELDKEIRNDPAAYDVSNKPTEKAIEKAIILQAKYQNAHNKMLRAKHAVDLMQAAVDALDHRKKALEKRVDLWLADYYAEPRAKGQTRQHREEVEKHSVRRKAMGVK